MSHQATSVKKSFDSRSADLAKVFNTVRHGKLATINSYGIKEGLYNWMVS